MSPKRTKKVQILRFDPLGTTGGTPGVQKKIIKILKAAFWFSVKAIASSAALSLYTLLDHRRVSYIYKKYISMLRAPFTDPRIEHVSAGL